MKQWRTWIVVLVSLAFVGAGCGSDGGSGGNNGNNGNNGGQDAGTQDAAQQMQVPDSYTYEAQYDLRFTELVFLGDPNFPWVKLNRTVETYMDQEREYPVVVLLSLKDFDADAGTVAVRAGAGLKSDIDCIPDDTTQCDYEWDTSGGADPQYNEGQTFEPDMGLIDGKVELIEFVATNDKPGGSVEKSIIPIRDIEFSGHLPTVRPDGNGGVSTEDKIVDGQLSGYVTLADAENAELTIGSNTVQLANLLERDTMNADRDEDGENDAWYIEATFKAESETVVTQ